MVLAKAQTAPVVEPLNLLGLPPVDLHEVLAGVGLDLGDLCDGGIREEVVHIVEELGGPEAKERDVRKEQLIAAARRGLVRHVVVEGVGEACEAQ